MKAFVTKNKEGKYYQSCYNQSPFTDNLFNANKYQYKKETEKILLNNSFTLVDTLEVVKITIAEGDLEQQLTEKDKEIEELKAYRKGAYEKYVSKCAYLQQQIKDTRKQVCDEIKDFINKYDALKPKQLFVMDLLRKLDQIK